MEYIYNKINILFLDNGKLEINVEIKDKDKFKILPCLI